MLRRVEVSQVLQDCKRAWVRQLRAASTSIREARICNEEDLLDRMTGIAPWSQEHAAASLGLATLHLFHILTSTLSTSLRDKPSGRDSTQEPYVRERDYTAPHQGF